jgi:opacity protein-like surface antigen
VADDGAGVMTALKALAGGLLGAAVFAATAQAADPPGTWYPREKPQPRYVELLSGWYMRADIGYRWNKIDSVSAGAPTTSHSIDDSFGASVGAGLKYQWFRSDITLDRGASSKFRATTAQPATTQPRYTGTIDSVSALANFYVDFGTWSGFTPYVGAGLGATYLRAYDYRDSILSPLVTGPSPKGEEVNFSWAWMAGVSFQIHPQWLVDVGFRHLQLGDVAMTAGTNPQLSTDSTTLRKLSTNEVRIGVRFLFD